MGIWKKSPRADPAEIARIQAVVTPLVADLQARAAEASRQSGRSVGWTDIPGQIKQRLRAQGVSLPDGYDVDMNGTVVYTNKTPFLQQAAWAATPFLAGQAASSLAGAFGGAGAGGARAAMGGIDKAVGAMSGGGGAGFMGFSPRSWLDAAIFGGQLFGDIWGTKQQVGASDRAAEAELQANREALAFLKEQWEVARKDFAPYLNLGHASAGRLSDYVTNTPTPTMPANLRQQMEGGYDPQTYTPRPGWTPPARPAQTPVPTPARDLPRSKTSSSQEELDEWKRRGGIAGPATNYPPRDPPVLVPGSTARQSMPSLADFGRTPVSTTQPVSMQRVRVQAPDGEIRELPMQQAAVAMRLGARRVA